MAFRAGTSEIKMLEEIALRNAIAMFRSKNATETKLDESSHTISQITIII